MRKGETFVHKLGYFFHHHNIVVMVLDCGKLTTFLVLDGGEFPTAQQSSPVWLPAPVDTPAAASSASPLVQHICCACVLISIWSESASEKYLSQGRSHSFYSDGLEASAETTVSSVREVCINDSKGQAGSVQRGRTSDVSRRHQSIPNAKGNARKS